MNLNGERFLPAGTILVCPKCGKPQATLSIDVYPDYTYDFRCITPFDKDASPGVSLCHDERYVTFSGVFYTQDGPY